MIEFRLLNDSDIPLIETWLNKKHVKKWYEIPRLGITVDDWVAEIKEYTREYKWITYLIVLWENTPIGLCLHYKCEDSKDEDYGELSLTGAYGIDYLIGEEDCLGKGLGKEMITLLVEKIFSFSNSQSITAEVDNNNEISQKVLLSCGFSLLESKNCRYVLFKESK